MPLKIAAKVDAADREYFEQVIEPLLDDPLVEFIGEIGDAEKAAFLGGARGLLFPIDWPEPFGLVMIEAMACGTPVIAPTVRLGARGRSTQGARASSATRWSSWRSAVKRVDEHRPRRRAGATSSAASPSRRMADGLRAVYAAGCRAAPLMPRRRMSDRPARRRAVLHPRLRGRRPTCRSSCSSTTRPSSSPTGAATCRTCPHERVRLLRGRHALPAAPRAAAARPRPAACSTPACREDAVQAAVDLTNPDVPLDRQGSAARPLAAVARRLDRPRRPALPAPGDRGFNRGSRSHLASRSRFAADFVDVFEVRGHPRERRGAVLPARIGGAEVRARLPRPRRRRAHDHAGFSTRRPTGSTRPAPTTA